MGGGDDLGEVEGGGDDLDGGGNDEDLGDGGGEDFGGDVEVEGGCWDVAVLQCLSREASLSFGKVGMRSGFEYEDLGDSVCRAFGFISAVTCESSEISTGRGRTWICVNAK